jgi:hypothetical protein
MRAGSTAPVTIHALRRDGFTNEITLALKDAPPGFTLSGGRIPAGQDQVKATINAPAVPEDEHVPIKLEGRATIGGQTVARPVVPADDLMQAFFYRHLVPAQEMQVAVAGRFKQRGVVKILSPTTLQLPVGGTARVQVGFPRGPYTDRVQFELSDPPEGISIKDFNLTRSGAEIILQSDATKATSGTRGNLLLTVSTGRAATQPGPAAGNRQRRSLPLPALPFEITAAANPVTTK